MTPEAKLVAMGLTLPEIPRPMANYVPFKIDKDVLYLSGQGPRRNDGTMMIGKVGRDVSVEEAYEHAKLVGLGLLAAAKAASGELAKIEVLKVLGMVNAVRGRPGRARAACAFGRRHGLAAAADHGRDRGSDAHSRLSAAPCRPQASGKLTARSRRAP